MDVESVPSGRTLWVMRHAQAVEHWAGGDHGRPLTEAGVRAAAGFGRLKPPGPLAAALALGCRAPTMVVASDATRTRQTAEAVRAAAGLAEVQVERALYRASGDDLLAWVWTLSDETVSVVLVGHNPAVLQLVATLVGPGSPDHFRPGTVAVVDLAADRWTAVGPGSGRLRLVATT